MKNLLLIFSVHSITSLFGQIGYDERGITEVLHGPWC